MCGVQHTAADEKAVCFREDGARGAIRIPGPTDTVRQHERRERPSDYLGKRSGARLHLSHAEGHPKRTVELARESAQRAKVASSLPPLRSLIYDDK